jgi:hypothetical protein
MQVLVNFIWVSAISVTGRNVEIPVGFVAGNQGLFRRFLFVFLGEGEALRFFPASRAFLNVISSVAVPHKPQYSSLLRRFPSCFRCLPAKTSPRKNRPLFHAGDLFRGRAKENPAHFAILEIENNPAINRAHHIGPWLG